MPRIDYGPPGHRGVSRLMAVGDDEYPTATTQALTTGTALAGAAFLAGVIAGSRTLRTLGLGGAIALVGVRLATRPRPVVAAPPQPASTAGWS